MIKSLSRLLDAVIDYTSALMEDCDSRLQLLALKITQRIYAKANKKEKEQEDTTKSKANLSEVLMLHIYLICLFLLAGMTLGVFIHPVISAVTGGLTAAYVMAFSRFFVGLSVNVVTNTLESNYAEKP